MKPYRLHGLDHLRTLAILLVFIFHYGILSQNEPSWLQPLAKTGWTGVDLFFVLSGYLISSALFRQVKESGSFPYRDFLIKRSFRILPAYFFTVVIYFLFAAVREKESLPPLWKYLTFTQNIGLDAYSEGTFSHAWSLCVEEHFYFLLPVTLLLLLYFNQWKRGGVVLLLVFGTGVILRVYSYQELYLPHSEDEFSSVYWSRYIYYPTYTRLDGLLIGVAIAALQVFRQQTWQKIESYGNWWILFSLLVFSVGYSFLDQDQELF